jgi:hypothetical protein
MIARPRPNFRFCFSISLEEMTKVIVKVSENSQCLDSDMKQITSRTEMYEVTL